MIVQQATLPNNWWENDLIAEWKNKPIRKWKFNDQSEETLNNKLKPDLLNKIKSSVLSSNVGKDLHNIIETISKEAPFIEVVTLLENFFYDKVNFMHVIADVKQIVDITDNIEQMPKQWIVDITKKLNDALIQSQSNPKQLTLNSVKILFGQYRGEYNIGQNNFPIPTQWLSGKQINPLNDFDLNKIVEQISYLTKSEQKNTNSILDENIFRKILTEQGSKIQESLYSSLDIELHKIIVQNISKPVIKSPSLEQAKSFIKNKNDINKSINFYKYYMPNIDTLLKTYNLKMEDLSVEKADLHYSDSSQIDAQFHLIINLKMPNREMPMKIYDENFFVFDRGKFIDAIFNGIKNMNLQIYNKVIDEIYLITKLNKFNNVGEIKKQIDSNTSFDIDWSDFIKIIGEDPSDSNKDLSFIDDLMKKHQAISGKPNIKIRVKIDPTSKKISYNIILIDKQIQTKPVPILEKNEQLFKYQIEEVYDKLQELSFDGHKNKRLPNPLDFKNVKTQSPAKKWVLDDFTNLLELANQYPLLKAIINNNSNITISYKYINIANKKGIIITVNDKRINESREIEIYIDSKDPKQIYDNFKKKIKTLQPFVKINTPLAIAQVGDKLSIEDITRSFESKTGDINNLQWIDAQYEIKQIQPPNGMPMGKYLVITYTYSENDFAGPISSERQISNNVTYIRISIENATQKDVDDSFDEISKIKDNILKGVEKDGIIDGINNFTQEFKDKINQMFLDKKLSKQLLSQLLEQFKMDIAQKLKDLIPKIPDELIKAIKDGFDGNIPEHIEEWMDQFPEVVSDLKAKGIKIEDIIKLLKNDRMRKLLSNYTGSLPKIINAVSAASDNYKYGYFASGAALGLTSIGSAGALIATIKAQKQLKKSGNYRAKFRAVKLLPIVIAGIMFSSMAGTIVSMIWFFIKKGGF